MCKADPRHLHVVVLCWKIKHGKSRCMLFFQCFTVIGQAVFVNDKALLDDAGLVKISDGNHMFQALQNIWTLLHNASAEERQTMQDSMGPAAMQYLCLHCKFEC